ncbi:hypothetical protein [Paraburkholderia sp. BL25I1N1]|uniref:hypothetical protein n=1 Tax=Paraburkholderia sp. BL25I1N1 TaxID=1938804 RepID=UPI000D04AF1B|nr:hypothetical protein [Paraburkholderia sp. BL25I1N1]PRY03798.1 hypothetical protein B0G73_114119 [Paraburkholderia sp. BL25I1N1]
MATNDFLPFANGGAANVLPQSAYAALTSLLSGGFQSGVAQSIQVNKVLRQSSIMAAVLGQFIVNITGQNATDDGTTATLLANLTAAINANSAAIAGTARNLNAILTTQGTTATWTADEILIKSALGGLAYQVGSFSKSVNLSGSGIGGVVGTAPAANGFAAIYAAIGSSGVGAFATDATAAKAPEVASVTLPAGYTWGAQLIGIAPVSATATQFAPFAQIDRRVGWGGGNLLTGSTFVGGPIARTSTLIPFNARFISGFNQLGCTAASAISQVLTPTSIAGLDGQYNTCNIQSGASQAIPFRVAVIAPQTIYQQSSNSTGTPGFTISTNSFEF